MQTLCVFLFNWDGVTTNRCKLGEGRGKDNIPTDKFWCFTNVNPDGNHVLNIYGYCNSTCKCKLFFKTSFLIHSVFSHEWLQRGFRGSLDGLLHLPGDCGTQELDRVKGVLHCPRRPDGGGGVPGRAICP